LKTKFILPIVFLLSLVFLAGCKKDPGQSSTQPPVAPTLQVSVNATQVSLGDSVTVSWQSTNATSVQIMWSGPAFNGLPPNGSQKVGPLQINTTITVTAIGPGGSVKKDKSVTVTNLPPDTLKISVSADLSTVPWNTNTTIIVQITGADSSKSDLPGFSGVSGSFPTPLLTSRTTFHFTAYGKGLIAKDSVTIDVIPETKTQMLTYKPWKIIKMDTTLNGNWGNFPFSPCRLDDLLIFKVDGTYEIHQGTDWCVPGGPELIANGLWYFFDNDTKLNRDGGIYDIDSLTSSRLIWTTVLPPYGYQLKETYSNE